MLYLFLGFALGVLWLAAYLVWRHHPDEWISAEREAAEARIVDLCGYREAALRMRVERDVAEAIEHAESAK